MRRLLLTAALLFFVAGAVMGQVSEMLEEADELYDDEQYQRAVSVLERAASRAAGGSERAEVYWRLSRAQLGMGDELRDEEGDNDAAMEVYDRGMEYADEAIAADPQNNMGYYWKASNLGRWGETRGILSSLSQAKPMRDLLEQSLERDPEHSQSYYVLGLLYARVPGGLISFGNTDYAVSLGRKARDLHMRELRRGEEEEEYYPVSIELASHLIDRGWSAGKRRRRQSDKQDELESADGILEQSFYYEATVNLPRMSDEEEARGILEEVTDELEDEARPGTRKGRHLERARELMDAI
jgi:tetratricopeptide (TPR) repeat protein